MRRLPDNDRGRLAANQTASNVINDGDTSILLDTGDVHRCTRCGKPITSAKSIRFGMGKDCRRIPGVIA